MTNKVTQKNQIGNVHCGRIGIMGGTFNPIHYGHLVTAESARIQFNLDSVLFVPSGNPPHKSPEEILDKDHRYIMTLLATTTNPYFEVSKVEVEREGYTYTVDTINYFNRIYDGKAKLYFITGADAIDQILTWKNVEKLLTLCEFVAATRPGYEHDELYKNIKYLQEHYHCVVHFMEIPSLEISSTEIRERLKKGLSIKYLLPDQVENYIYKNKLYF